MLWEIESAFPVGDVTAHKRYSSGTNSLQIDLADIGTYKILQSQKHRPEKTKVLEKYAHVNNLLVSWKLEASMQSFEIRILRGDGLPGLIAQKTYLNTDAAIASGRILARGRRFEVWSDDSCVYPDTASARSAQKPPRASA